MIDEVMFEIREMTGQEYRNHYAGEAPDTATEPQVVARPGRVTDPVRGPARARARRRRLEPFCPSRSARSADRDGRSDNCGGELSRANPARRAHLATSERRPNHLTHRVVAVNGIRLHVVEAGEALVLLVHGFPESWYSWRHQLPVLAAAGYRAVALDVRGYGRSSAPPAVEAYRMLRIVADNVALVRRARRGEAVVVGHDWGAPIAWNSALLRPDVFRAVAGLSVPFAAGDTRPTDAFRAMAGDEEFYIEYFQQPGRAEAEIEERRPALAARLLLLGLRGRADAAPGGGTVATIPHGGRMCRPLLLPGPMPAWLTEEDLDVYAGEFERTGFTGGLNRYRNVDRDWEDLSAFRGRPIEVPALFIGGDRTAPRSGAMRSIERFAETLPRLHPLDHPRRLRALDAAGAPGRGQRGAARVPRRSA